MKTTDPSSPPPTPAKLEPLPAPASGRAAPGRKGMDLTRGPIWSSLLIFSAPIMLQMSIQPIYAMIDSIYIARLGPGAFKAVTNAATLQMLVIMIAAGLANGVTSFVARLVGAGKLEEADNAAVHAMILMLLFSTATIAVFYPFADEFMTLLGLEPNLLPEAVAFNDPIMIGNITIMFFLIGANILRGEGDSNTPLIIALFTVGLNVLLAPPLIFGPEERFWGLRVGWLGLGVFGASLATVISRGVGCLLLIFYLRNGKHVWTFTLKNYRHTPSHFAQILKVGFPMLLVNLVGWIATLIFIRVLNPYPGGVEAYGMGIRLDQLAVLPTIGLMLGVVAMVGQNFGAGKLDRVRATALVGGGLAAVFSALMVTIYNVFPDFWVSLFNQAEDPATYRLIHDLSLGFIRIVGLTYLFVAQAFVLGGVFQGLGKGAPPLVITLVRFFLVAVPLILILPARIGPSGAWWAIGASHVTGGVIAAVWLWIELRRLPKKS